LPETPARSSSVASSRRDRASAEPPAHSLRRLRCGAERSMRRDREISRARLRAW
jgi:hypothetical protein